MDKPDYNWHLKVPTGHGTPTAKIHIQCGPEPVFVWDAKKDDETNWKAMADLIYSQAVKNKEQSALIDELAATLTDSEDFLSRLSDCADEDEYIHDVCKKNRAALAKVKK